MKAGKANLILTVLKVLSELRNQLRANTSQHNEEGKYLLANNQIYEEREETITMVAEGSKKTHPQSILVSSFKRSRSMTFIQAS